MLRISMNGLRLVLCLGLVLHEIAQSIIVVLLLLDVENISVGIAAALLGSVSGKYWLLFIPLILM